MYLEATKSFYNSNYMQDDPKYKDELEMHKKLKEMFPDMFDSGNLGYIRVTFEAGYWRKANEIHKWFVDECQDGVDDCRRSWVDRKKLEELRDLCKEVLKDSKTIDSEVEDGYTYKDGKKVVYKTKGKVITNPEVAQKLLPTQSGFFFGGTDYDQWYIDDLERTVEILNKCLSLPESWDFYYHSSW